MTLSPEQAICKLYKLHSDSEQYATAGVLRDVLNCRDDINDIDYFTFFLLTFLDHLLVQSQPLFQSSSIFNVVPCLQSFAYLTYDEITLIIDELFTN